MFGLADLFGWRDCGKLVGRDSHDISPEDSVDCSEKAFVPDDFADADCFKMSQDSSMDDGGFDKALFDFYVNHKVKYLKRKITTAGQRNVKRRRSSDFPTSSTFTRYSGKLFSKVVSDLTPRQLDVIHKFGADCLLNFVKTEVPLRFVKWLASKFDVAASEFQLRKKFIPLTKYVIHDILDLPVDGVPIVSDVDAGRGFLLSHFNVTSIPQVSFFVNKLKSTEAVLSDEDIFICFMCIAFCTFLCPNSSLSPSPKYLHIFRDCSSVMNYNLSRFVYECLLSSIRKFKEATKVLSKRSVTFGGCHYAFAVSYLDRVHFGLHSLPGVKPRILVWRGNKIKEFSELDKNNSRSYGKRPLKRLSPSIFLPKSCEKHSSSAVHEVVTPLIPFATKVERRFAGRFGIENVKQLIGLVQSSNADKPEIFREWSESLVIKVLDSLASSSFNVTDGFSPRLNAEVNFQNISSTPTLKISSNVQHSSQKHFGDCPSVHDQSNKVQNMAKDSGNVTSESSKVNIGVSPVIPKPTNVDDPIVNPFLSEAAKIPKELSLRAVSDIGHVDACESGVDPVKRVLLPKVPGQPEVVNEGTSPCTAQVHMDIPRSSTVPSASPLKNRKPAVTSVVFEIPSMSNLIGATNSNIPHSAAADVCNVNIIDNDLDFQTAMRNLSPIVPVRLSQLFQDEGDDVQCSQYQRERFKESRQSPCEEDCIVMVTLPHSDVSKSVKSSKIKTVDLTSPFACNESIKKYKIDDFKDEVQIVGTSSFSTRCVELSRKTNDAYNKLNNFSAVASSILSDKKHLVIDSADDCFITDQPIAVNSKPVFSSNVPGSSTISQQAHIPRRIVAAGRYNSDPYVQQLNRFPVSYQERRHYVAINHIGSHETWCKYEAIRFDRAYCSYRSLSTRRPNGRIDNFLILCYCRYLFNLTHPSVSKKHFFFSYIGETILRNDNLEIVQHAFEGANSAFRLWRSNFITLFSYCLKDRAFAFLDSAYSENSSYHTDIRDQLIGNFIALWDIIITPIMNRRIDFENFDDVYPGVPKQTNRHDCGVFTLKYMEIFTPRTQMANQFSSRQA